MDSDPRFDSGGDRHSFVPPTVKEMSIPKADVTIKAIGKQWYLDL